MKIAPYLINLGSKRQQYLYISISNITQQYVIRMNYAIRGSSSLPTYLPTYSRNLLPNGIRATFARDRYASASQSAH